jgi:UDP-2-acetamido-2,6-beta-L-arabino-hexul-4-ose reductase
LIANNLDVEIQVDTELEMIYVQDLVVSIISVILEEKYSEELHLSSTGRISVSELKNLLITFHQIYGNGIIPRMEDRFEISLFNTYRSYLPQDFFPVLLTKHSDNRGVFVEVIRSFGEGQYSFSTTNPGITRGNHYHIRKIERFAVISGRASIKIRQIGTQEVREYIIEGENPGYVDIPIWHTHCITNIGDSELITLFWINEFYNPSDPDTFFESV